MLNKELIKGIIFFGALVVLSRIVPHPPNFTPLLAGLIFLDMKEAEQNSDEVINEDQNTEEEPEEEPIIGTDILTEDGYPAIYDMTTTINIPSPSMSLIGEDKDQIELDWTDYDGKITWSGEPDGNFQVDEYLIEFRIGSTWK